MRKSLEHHLERMQSEKDEEGFTLIELLVVLLIIGILLAIAIPTFLSVTHSANNTASQSNLQTAVTAGDAYFTANNQSFTGVDNPLNTSLSIISQQNTGLIFTSGTASTDSKHVDLSNLGNPDYLVYANLSTGNARCYAILDLKATGAAGASPAPQAVGTWYGYFPTSVAPCTAANALAKIPATSPTVAGSWNNTTWK